MAATTGCSPTGDSATRPRADGGERRRVAVAFSGGRDSTALLHATVHQAAGLGISLIALHVHHGLSVHADEWLDHAEGVCRRWARRGLPLVFFAHRVESTPARGESVEAWARRARYRALREMAIEHGADLVLLGHHRRDQAETFLLQALRGGGVAALAAMPKLVRREGITWSRPWLDEPREAIDAYARRHRLGWIDDDSNESERFARNRLRLLVWPALAGAFEDAEASLAAAASRVQQAAAVVDEVAALDLASIAKGGAALDLVAWRDLSIARRRQALLRWLRGILPTSPPASLVDRLMREASAAGAQRRWTMTGGELRSYRGRLEFVTKVASAPVDPTPTSIDLRRVGLHQIAAWGGAFRVEPVEEGGIGLATARRLELRARAAGDRFQAGAKRPPRSLKLQFQAHGVAPDLRRGPIVCADGAIAFVPGLGIDARALAPAGTVQVSLEWLPD